MTMSTKTLIRNMSNKDLLQHINKIRQEKADPQTYGKYGTSRWVTASEFWAGHHGTLKQELARRQRLGKISPTAGKPRKRTARRSTGWF